MLNFDENNILQDQNSGTAIYIRVSTDQLAQKLSPEHQIATCREYIEENNLIYDENFIYQDNGISGTNMENRPSVQQMLMDARQNKFKVIIFTAISRFARDLSDALSLKKKLEVFYGIRIISIEEGYDTFVDGRNSEMIFTVHAMLASHKSKEVAIAIRRGLRQSSISGRHVGSKPPYGYKKDENLKLIPDPETSWIIQKIFNLYHHEGYASKTIATILNEENVPPFQAKKWGASTIVTILHNCAYRGDLIANKWRKSTNYELSKKYDKQVKKFAQRDESDWVIIPNNHEPLIKPEIFDLVQDALKNKVKRRSRKNRTNVLSSFLRCGECDSAMIVTTCGNEKYKYIKCSTRIRIGNDACTNQINFKHQIIMQEITNILLSSPNTDKPIYNPDSNAPKLDVDQKSIDHLQYEIEKVKKSVVKLNDGYLNGDFEKEYFLDKKSELTKKQNKIQKDLEKLIGKTQNISEKPLLHANEFKTVVDVIKNIENYENFDVNNALKIVLREIVFHADKSVDFHWKFII